MNDSEKNKQELIEELHALRGRVREMTQTASVREHIQDVLQHSAKAEHEFNEVLGSLVEVVNELSVIPAVDEMCRQAVLLARHRLGFERLGIWFRTKDPWVFTGSYGVDAFGEIVDERTKTNRIDPGSPEARMITSKVPIITYGSGPVVDSTGAEVGQAEQVFAPIWDGTAVIGHISMDNRVTHRPITSHQCELLRLFASSLGYLVTRARAHEDRERLINELQAALNQINTLSGLLPICASCKKIRDDHGYWSQIEEYIQQHSEAEFSHSICPDCVERLYPELAKRKNGEETEEPTPLT